MYTYSPWGLYIDMAHLIPEWKNLNIFAVHSFYKKSLDTLSLSGTSPFFMVTVSNPGAALAWKDGEWSAMLVTAFCLSHSVSSMHFLEVESTTRTPLAVGLVKDRYEQGWPLSEFPKAWAWKAKHNTILRILLRVSQCTMY